MPQTTPPKTDRIVPRALLGLLAAIGFGLLVWIAGRAWLARTPDAASMTHAPSTAPNTFRPTAQQRANLRIEPVRPLVFTTEIHAEGSIAYDEDATTPVYSP